MTDIGLISYYLNIEVKKEDKGYAKEVLKKFNMDDQWNVESSFLSMRKEIRWIPLSIKVW